MDTGRKCVLIVEDEAVNREILIENLKKDYDLVTADSGAEARRKLSENEGKIHIILLDLNLPDVKGTDIIKQFKEEGILETVPVIVITSDREAEVESLTVGAMDFIPKPYPRSDVMIARIRRTIELFEGRFLIGQTERDPLTGLYNREYFYRYAERFDDAHAGLAMDAIAVDINHFRIINERYGKQYGDEVLKRLADKIRSAVKDDRGIVCHRDADIFLVYCPHRGDYTDLLDQISKGLAGEGMDDKTVRIRMGVYPNVDKEIDIERRFDRAKMAADTVRSTFTKAVAIFDNELHESTVFSEQLLIDFPKAIEEKQFVVYYQPKYDIRGDEPVLNSAEALVRWEHPDFGLISPGIFIPLFEQNGLIRQLDSYVWKAAALQIKDWYRRLGAAVPVSVNVSRVDMYDQDLVKVLSDLVKDAGLRQDELLLEVTESAYTGESLQIVDTAEKLREAGFYIEMDDFGSGYSSLNMISNLPIDALKLDMQFIRSAFKNGKNTRMLEIVIEIADSLSVPVIAEGVETAEQLFTLKAMGCDIVQGYYFSKPVPPEKFELFLMDKQKQGSRPDSGVRKKQRRVSHDSFTYEAMHDPQTGLYNQSAFDLLLYDADKAHAALVLFRLKDLEIKENESGPENKGVIARRTAELIKTRFRSTDLVFRTGEDEFAVIVTRINSAQRDFLESKVNGICESLKEEIVIHSGAAFGDRENADGDIFQDADSALLRAIEEGRNGCVIF